MTDLALNHLKAAAPEFGAAVTSEAPDHFDSRIEIDLPGGQIHTFHLRIHESGLIPKAFEMEPRDLPSACLERHINSDGSFCLGWANEEASEVTDEASAKQYWSRVFRFLQHQVTASKIRRWPGGKNARAHGDAAMYQSRAEKLAATLGSSVAEDLKHGKLIVRADTKLGNRRLELLRHGKRVARVHLDKQQLITDRTSCFCDESMGSRTAIGACRNHAQHAVELAVSIYEWHRRHNDFVHQSAQAGMRCCGTMEFCELKRARLSVSSRTRASRGNRK